ncbi:unnamed protein product, partial [Didymodactylos carnosus]
YKRPVNMKQYKQDTLLEELSVDSPDTVVETIKSLQYVSSNSEVTHRPTRNERSHSFSSPSTTSCSSSSLSIFNTTPDTKIRALSADEKWQLFIDHGYVKFSSSTGVF